MIFSAITPCTLQDYPGHLAMMVFTPGCNFRCGYCHNPEFVDPTQIRHMQDSFLSEEVVISFLKKRRGLLDGVVICGGEPSIQKGLLPFIRRVKALGFLVKLDTNGSHPEVLEECFSEHLVDYVAMDLKCDPHSYEHVSGVRGYEEAIEKSMALLGASGVDYELRSTIFPSLHSSDMLHRMGKAILRTQGKKAKEWILQRFSPKVTLDPRFEKEDTFTLSQMEMLAEELQPYGEKISLRF